ncbi:MAG TPA: mandelate racemase/muconate lactonizing enzyme family protein, partial [Solirubrobacteraceae bacterium]|nr:mandelate racemase/muconate lactonizing enzyme family protein [Solirubrobacteraceae bacterium]
DMALWDLEGHRTGSAVWQLLGAAAADPVEVNYTIASADRAGAVAEAAQAKTAGFPCVKVKVGIGDDAGRVAAVRAVAGPDVAIRLDANGAWTAAEATAALRALEPAGIELCEEAVTGLSETRELSGLTSVPLSIDETAASPGALEHRVCDAVCLKIARCGGITGLIDGARRARAAGYQVYLASTLDGPLGIAAALHAAAALDPDRPSGLATLGLFVDAADSLAPRGGRIAVPDGPGLGSGLARWYRTGLAR